MTMTSSKPYLIRAMFDWIIDNEFTPYLAINAEHPKVQIPADLAVDVARRVTGVNKVVKVFAYKNTAAA